MSRSISACVGGILKSTVFWLAMNSVFSMPIRNQGGLPVPSPAIINFMRRYGYLQQTAPDSEALYHESAIEEAVKGMQKYGALNQTGTLDSATLRLMVAPRCGVPDIETHRDRAKRYANRSKRWVKRRLTYFIANWSPKLSEAQVEKNMRRAFNVWASYSNLVFTRVYSSTADIIIAFGSYYHGDSYPFDGPGNILAHAFYPYDLPPLGGDIHFDDDENWVENGTNYPAEVDHFSVAIHEIGHSLGLAHSPSYSSIMFPYYKGPGDNILSFEDTLDMYNMYITAIFEDDADPVEKGDEVTETVPSTSTTTVSSTTEDDSVEAESPNPSYTTYEGDYESVDDHLRRHDLITIGVSTGFQNWSTVAPVITTKRDHDLPNICTGSFDAVVTFRGDVFIFKESYVWRLTDKYRIVNGYPVKIVHVFPFLPQNASIDAAYERKTDGALVLFSSNLYWVYDGYDLLDGSPRSIQEYGPDENVTSIGAAMLWPKNQKTYIFVENQFWRYDDESKQLDPGYPKSMRRWRGIPDGIDAVTTVSSGKTYFFKDNLYWLYNNYWVRPQRGYPRVASDVWLGCSSEMKQF